MTQQVPSASTDPAKTETSDSRYEALDLWPTSTLLDVLLESQLGAVASVKTALPGMEDAITAALPRLQRGGRLFYVGAGTSGRIGLQDGVELIPTYGWPEDRLVLLLAGGNAALFQPVEGAEDDEEAARTAIIAHNAGPDDVVIGVAASGGTPYTCAALSCARAAGSLTIGLSCSPHTRLLRDAELGLLIETGPEVVAGSTRMKAGTAQKVALNMLSTALMIRLGHTWRGQMVDMKIVNAKLVRRAHRMVQQLTDCTEAEASTALEKAEGSIKLAILVCFGFSPEEGRTLLAEHAGNLRSVLKNR
ncbi:N-acetylmuramic acid 6-phosphate etherase [Acetobacter orleanensis]|uniref:N-acetylmuramic acid 6-phosphate etherase n=1 Tax=Acetobacter orleanensis TaxID=104099 RepID=A0A4Y3TQE2_9PROT|nr:N-acetylmuramic acid 6-phosphate etherase [Acetobacter orleanensis]KXV66229.1 N-acetylmuramic acid-6-phosphate etherase [Acetobacter orleanensis]PCD78577.1 N-acetylmuramic acid 6-phosphate etherase [Acetobacter orleanensis]GAN69898.1 N-acetylmuramic acid 6-phosphate etherase [Acetobacter orleanensis JCM 7639]GBR31006.1 N-acetylmuramic acid 6-phosphate etherase [Acetobacter orleanensis NRIC 0473]GEB83669.1 N-acetylmuramic acid 6-phosphate etherase [Acetobacter orleanensis]